MLHRLALRVLPQLSLAVTEPDIRTRKRWVMFVIGFVAFALYRLAKVLVPLGNPFALLAVAGLIGALTAAVAYGIGRRADWTSPAQWRSYETPRRWAWLLGWIGGVYAVQLALLVLSLLQLGVNYDFLQHPDGPAMMAIIISCTAVARDAVEIGHVRWLETKGRSFLTFPDGTSLRALASRDPQPLLSWGVIGALLSGVVTWLLSAFISWGGGALAQLGVATLIGGTVSLCAYLDGMSRPQPWWARLQQTSWWELTKFWWWPGAAFAATYFLVVYGIGEFVFQMGPASPGHGGLVAGAVGMIMGLYSYYLGARRAFESRIVASVPESMLRCPFITGILGSRPAAPSSGSVAAMPADALAFSEAPHAARMERVP